MTGAVFNRGGIHDETAVTYPYAPVARCRTAHPRAVLQRELRCAYRGGNGYRFRYGSRGGKLLPGAGR